MSEEVKQAQEAFKRLGPAKCVHNNGFDLYIPQEFPPEAGYFYVESHHGHNGYAVDYVSTHTYYVIDGEGIFIVNDETKPVHANSVITINPNEVFYYKGAMRLIEKIEPNFKEENFQVLKAVSYDEEPITEPKRV